MTTSTKTLDTLPKDIYDLFDPDNDHQVNDDNISSFLSALDGILRSRLAKQQDSRTPLRFSSLGKPDRQIWYDAHPEEGSKEELSGKTRFKFLYGDVIEALVLFLAKEAGHTVEREQEEIELDGVLGHIDAIVDGVVVDVKSASPYGYLKFKNGNVVAEDPFGYVAQLSGYANVLTPGNAAAWVAFDKVSGDLCVSTLSQSIIKDHDPQDRITHLKEVIDNADPPVRCHSDTPDGKSGNFKLGTACSYCPHKNRCWPGLRTYLYSNGPRFLTRVVREPDVPELIAGTVEEPEVTD